MSKENYIVTQIGSEISVLVYFDYQPEEKATRDSDIVYSEVSINAVYVGGDKDKDIEEELSDKCIQSLKVECEDEYLAHQLAAYEMSQEES